MAIKPVRPGRPPFPIRRAGLLLTLGCVAATMVAATIATMAGSEPPAAPDGLADVSPAATQTEPRKAKPRKPNPWSEALRGQPYAPNGARLVFTADFTHAGGRSAIGLSGNPTLNGPLLWAGQHSDYGHARFDIAGDPAYARSDQGLLLTAYRGATGLRGANVQSISDEQANRGKPISAGRNGFVCAGCYWQARMRFPRAKGTWAGFWLLTPDDPKARGHLEVDVIEYYGPGDPRGHHHSLHRWGPPGPNRHKGMGDYTGIDALADFDWHDYGADLRGTARLNGQPAAVITMDGREVARIAADADFFSKPFYYLLSLTIGPHPEKAELPQSVEVASVKVWK